MKVDNTCRRCKGEGKVTVSRELSHDLETCNVCRGSGVYPEKYLRQERLATTLDEAAFWEAGYERMGYLGEIIRVFLDVRRIPELYEKLPDIVGDYRPKLVDIVEVEGVGHRAELVFSPYDG